MKSKHVRGSLDLRIVVVHEEEKWCAIALEMSLLGYGDTPEEACEDLWETVKVQIVYALEQYQSIEHILVRAEPQYFKIYEAAKREELQARFSRPTRAKHRKHLAKSMRLPRKTDLLGEHLSVNASII